MGDIASLHDAVVELLAASADALDTIPLFDPTLEGAPDRQVITAGQPVMDCCDQLAATATQVLDAPLAPGGLAAGRKIAGKINHVAMAVTITRCYPMPDENGQPPTTDEQTEAARQINADGWALWNHLYNMWRADLLFTFCDELFFDSMRPLGPSGGCAGWVLQIRISLDGYEETFST